MIIYAEGKTEMFERIICRMAENTHVRWNIDSCRLVYQGREKYLLGTFAASTRLSLQIPGEFRNEERENANIAYRMYNWAKIWLNIEIRVKLLVNFSLEFHLFFKIKRRANEQTLLLLPYTNYQYFIIFKKARVKHSRKHIFNRKFLETANNPHTRKTGRKSERGWRISRAS